MSHYFTNDNLESNLKKVIVNVNDRKFVFNTDNGVFSKKGLDFGSRTLIDALLSLDISGKCLDVGCGYGAIGIVLSSFFNLDVDMIDVNKRAVHLAVMNIKENDVSARAFYSDVYGNVNEKYDVIVTNPPIRAGKEIVYKILFGARDYLTCGGALYFVINKDQGAKSVIRDLGEVAFVSVLKKNKGFYVIKCIFD
ncbi:MAG: class I SAM-dependent methyltransferase [Bacilli bacterium]